MIINQCQNPKSILSSCVLNLTIVRTLYEILTARFTVTIPTAIVLGNVIGVKTTYLHLVFVNAAATKRTDKTIDNAGVDTPAYLQLRKRSISSKSIDYDERLRA